MASKKSDRTGGELCCCSSSEMSRVKKENADLRKALDELALQKGGPPDCENSQRLLKRILSLETLREKSSQQLMAKDQDIASLTQQLLTGRGDRETVVGQQAQIDHYLGEAEQRERLFLSLQAETEDVKNKLVAVSAKCQELEGRNNAGQQSRPPDGQASSSSAAVMQDHLRDALEKNQQWLAYDQQREGYVKAVLSRVFGLEQQLNQAKQALTQQHNEAHSDERRSVEMQEHYDKLLLTAKTELEGQREQVDTAQRELTEMQWRCEEKHKEVSEIKQQLQAERQRIWKSAQEERRRSGDREGRLRAEAEDLRGRLEEERHRSAELLLQVNLLQRSLLSQQDEEKHITILEQQIQVSAKDLEDERRDCQYLQKQLHKVLRELRKAKDHAAKLESEKELRGPPYPNQARHTPPKTARESVTSPSHLPNLLDESFLECPSCRAQYPTSHHRELLAHLDHCLG